MASSDTTGDAARRRLFSDVDVDATPSSLALFRCMGCAKVHIASTDPEESEGNIDKPKRCLTCLSVVYCGRECQRKDWVNGGHRKQCKAIYQLKDKLSANAEELRNLSLSSLNDNFWEVPETREYCHRRFALFDAIFSEATSRVWSSGGTPSITLTNRLALELALEHALDLLTLNSSDDMRIRCFIPSILIGLGKDHEAYGVIKYLLTNGDDIIEDKRGEHAHNLVCLVREKNEQDMSEPLEALDLREDSDVGIVFDLALIKFCMYHDTRNMQTLNRGEIPNPDISTAVAGFFDLSKDWMDIDASNLFLQTKQLLSCVHHLNKHILPNLMDPHRMLCLNPEGYAKGSCNEAALVIQRSAVWWKVNDFTHGFLRSFISGMDSQLVPFPLNQTERQMNIATIRGNVFERMNPRRAVELLGLDDDDDDDY